MLIFFYETLLSFLPENHNPKGLLPWQPTLGVVLEYYL